LRLRLRTVGFDATKRVLDFCISAAVLVALAPVMLCVAAAIKLESRGPVFYRCRRVGIGGTRLEMLKFRKMHVGARGGVLTSPGDPRFTRIGARLARTKLDELPQLWNVLKGEMSLVGPRPEDPSFVALRARDYAEILRVKPGVTGLSQLAFARESEILDDEHRYEHYVEQVFPQKIAIDRLYVLRRSFTYDLRILFWTAVAILLRREVAVSRQTGRLNQRRRPVLSADIAGSTV
jgi:lipopolysaccharide/colanic/teichoic acid biosynthesis glycosyltransferase